MPAVVARQLTIPGSWNSFSRQCDEMCLWVSSVVWKITYFRINRDQEIIYLDMPTDIKRLRLLAGEKARPLKAAVYLLGTKSVLDGRFNCN